MKNVLMILTDGFEDAEAVEIIDACGWTNYRDTTENVGVTVAGFQEQVEGHFGTILRVAARVNSISPSLFDALVIPGGFRSSGFDRIYCNDVYDIVRAMHDAGKPIFTLCVGSLPVAKTGVLAGGKATTYSFSRHDNFAVLEQNGCAGIREPLVSSNGVTSCAGPAQSHEIARLLLEALIGTEAAQEIVAYRKGV